MSKVDGYFRELEEINGPVEEPVEPSDKELTEIESTLDTVGWEDISWD